MAGTRLSPGERVFFKNENPWGFILFARNIDTPDQVRALTDELRDCAGRADTPILIDQEGGRVRRLRPPYWDNYPSAQLIGELYNQDQDAGLRASWAMSRLHALDLANLGISVDCLPVLDRIVEGSHQVIGDRSYGGDPQAIAKLGRAACDGLLEGGVLPVIKHIPGHGRATADTHMELPFVDAPLEELRKTDFIPFAMLADMPIAMTAHVVFAAIDPNAPATASARVINEIIRTEIGFNGLLMCDDLSMNALSGDFGHRTRSAFAAGCDVVLHCNGLIEEMQSVAAATGPLAGMSAKRAVDALACKRSKPAETADLRAEFEELISAVA